MILGLVVDAGLTFAGFVSLILVVAGFGGLLETRRLPRAHEQRQREGAFLVRHLGARRG